jgi:hypothetical protein
MKLNLKNLFIAGCTDDSDYDCPDLVWVYFSDQQESLPEQLPRDTPHIWQNLITPGDTIIVGQKDTNDKVIISQSTLYSISGTDRISISPAPDWSFFIWIEELDTYKPYTDAEKYWSDACTRWTQQKCLGRHGNRLTGKDSQATSSRPTSQIE